MNENNRSIEYLEKGDNLKKMGNIQSAYEMYEKSQELNPLNFSSYERLSKILIASGHYDLGFKNLLTYAHFVIKEGAINMRKYDENIGSYDWYGKLDDAFFVPENLAIKAVSTDFNLAKIIIDVDLTFNAGLAFLFKNRSIHNFKKIPASILNDNVQVLLGKKPTGQLVPTFEYTSMVRVTGLCYLLRNLITQEMSFEEISKRYFDEDFVIDNI